MRVCKRSNRHSGPIGMWNADDSGVPPLPKDRARHAWARILLTLAVLLSLAACSKLKTSSSGAGQETVVPVVTSGNTDVVAAEGSVEPARWSDLSIKVSGKVLEVLVETGDRVEAGAPLIRLDARELKLALRSAQQDAAAQQAALQQLLKGASDKVIARADKANRDQISQAEVALRAKELQLEQARAEDPAIAVAAAQAGVDQLQRLLAQTRAQDLTPSVTVAQVALERARIALDDMQDEYNKALDRPWEDQAIRDAWTKKLEQAQLDYRAAQAQLNSAQNAQRAHLAGLDVIAAQIAQAETQLAQALVAQKTYSTTLDITSAEVDAARLNLESLRTWDNPYRDQASEEEIAQARALVEKTQIAVETLQLKLEDTELLAPFAGTVVDVQAKVGDQVNPGQAVLVLATLDQLEIHTKDLTELDVGRVTIGQAASITADALPDRTFQGTVTEIALRSQDYRGDVVYQVTLVPADAEAAGALRWGMTTMVEIQAKAP